MSYPISAYRDRLELTRHFAAVLESAMQERPKRTDPVEELGELGWVVFERETMVTETNRLRALEGKPPVPADSVKWVEDRALGHVDYWWKFALGCAELVEEA